MKITILGSGTPAPSLKRACSGYMIEVGDDVIIMDHGPDAHRRLIESGKRATDVTHAFFTHLHYDHFLDYGRLVLQRWDMGAGKVDELGVYGPPPLARISEQLFGDDGVYGPDLDARTGHRLSLDIYELRGGALPRRKPNPNVTEISPGDVVDGGGWRVVVGEASHVQPYLQCHVYRLESAAGTICYTGDSGGITNSVVDTAAGCDVLIHMAHFESGTEPSAAYRAGCGGHMDVAEVARRASVKTLVMSHVLEHIDRPGTRERLINEAAEVFKGEIIWAEDLMQIIVGGEGQRTRAQTSSEW